MIKNKESIFHDETFVKYAKQKRARTSESKKALRDFVRAPTLRVFDPKLAKKNNAVVQQSNGN